MIEEYKRTMLYRINKAPGVESQYSTVLPVVPLQVSLTIQGIGGIKIGDLFYLRYLPKKYKRFCHFMVVNVEHGNQSYWLDYKVRFKNDCRYS